MEKAPVLPAKYKSFHMQEMTVEFSKFKVGAPLHKSGMKSVSFLHVLCFPCMLSLLILASYSPKHADRLLTEPSLPISGWGRCNWDGIFILTMYFFRYLDLP